MFTFPTAAVAPDFGFHDATLTARAGGFVEGHWAGKLFDLSLDARFGQ